MPSARGPRRYVVTLIKEEWVDQVYYVEALDELEALAVARGRLKADPKLAGFTGYTWKIVEVRRSGRKRT